MTGYEFRILFFLYICKKKKMNTYLVKKEDYQKHLAEYLSGFVFRQDVGENIRIKFFTKSLEKQILPNILPLLILEEKKSSN